MQNWGLSHLEFNSYVQRSWKEELPLSVWQSIAHCIYLELFKSAQKIQSRFSGRLATAILDEESEIESRDHLFNDYQLIEVLIGGFKQPNEIQASWYEIFGSREENELPISDYEAIFRCRGIDKGSLILLCRTCGWTCVNGEGHTTCLDGSCTSEWVGHFEINQLEDFVFTATSNFVEAHLQKHA